MVARCDVPPPAWKKIILKKNENKAGYQELVNAIIRPPRAEYEIEALGPVEFDFVGKPFKRMDFRLLNERGHVLECR